MNFHVGNQSSRLSQKQKSAAHLPWGLVLAVGAAPLDYAPLQLKSGMRTWIPPCEAFHIDALTTRDLMRDTTAI